MIIKIMTATMIIWTVFMFITLILSMKSYAIYGAGCIRLSHFSYDDCKNTCILLLIIIKSEVGPIHHGLELVLETMVCAFYILANFDYINTGFMSPWTWPIFYFSPAVLLLSSVPASRSKWHAVLKPVNTDVWTSGVLSGWCQHMPLWRDGAK